MNADDTGRVCDTLLNCYWLWI